MSKPSKLAEELNKKLDALHDSVIDSDPFSWSDSEKDRERRTTLFQDITEKLRTFAYVPKTGTIIKILLFGTVLPLMFLAALYFAKFPEEDDMRLLVWGGLIAIAVIFGVIAAVVADDPDIDSDLVLAAYTVPRQWSFSRLNKGKTWEAYHKRFGYFDQGDENHYIGTRIWGYGDNERKRPFQLFHFHYDTVYYVPVTTTVGKSTITTLQKHVMPHNCYGMFIAMPESKVRFRITEVCGDAGLDTHIKLEYSALNKAVDVYCDSKNELAVRQFLSPAVQEVVTQLSNDLDEMHIDFYPGIVLLVTTNNFLNMVDGIELDEQAPRFMESIQSAVDRIEKFRSYLAEGFGRIQKYNDNY